MVRPLLWSLAICLLLLLLAGAEAGCCSPPLPRLQQRSLWPAARGPEGEIDDGASLTAGQVSNPITSSSQPRWKHGPGVLWARRLLDRMLDLARQWILSVEIIIRHRVQVSQPEGESGPVTTGYTVPLIDGFFGLPVHIPVVSVGSGEPDFGHRAGANASSRVSVRHRGTMSTRSASLTQQLALLLLMLGTPWLLLVLVDAVTRLRVRQRFAQLSDWFSGDDHWLGWGPFQFAPETPLGRRNGSYQRRQRDYTARVSRGRDSTVRLLETIQALAEAMDASRQTNNWRSQLGEPPLGRAARPAPRHRSAAHTAQALTVPAIPVKRDGTTPGWGKPGARVREGRRRSRRHAVKVLWTREAA